MKIFLKILIQFIKLYQIVISSYLGNNCRYSPTCSNYFIQSLNEYGFFKGSFKGIKRLISCHPVKFLGGGSGYDPVKKEEN